mgnify:CR=1 FL=1
MKTNFNIPRFFINQLKTHLNNRTRVGNRYISPTITIVKLKGKPDRKSDIYPNSNYYGYKDTCKDAGWSNKKYDCYKVWNGDRLRFMRYSPDNFEKLDETTIQINELLNDSNDLLNMHW